MVPPRGCGPPGDHIADATDRDGLDQTARSVGATPTGMEHMMRKTIFSTITLVAALATAGVAMASPTVTLGTIKALDAKTHTVTLADGSVYQLPKGFKAEAFKAGEKVKITWEMKGKAHEASTMTAG